MQNEIQNFLDSLKESFPNVNLQKLEDARALLNAEFEKNSENHWLLTNLAFTYILELKYKEALDRLNQSLEIVDCPLTYWYKAVTLQELGRYDEAIDVYLLIIDSEVEGDLCWEDQKWNNELKFDAYERMGVCFFFAEKIAKQFCDCKIKI